MSETETDTNKYIKNIIKTTITHDTAYLIYWRLKTLPVLIPISTVVWLGENKETTESETKKCG